jgi:ATP-dependent Clp protease ATP-binding subunit ClpC
MEKINEYLIDYTELALQDELQELVGREDELKRIIQILLRFNKNNPILTGLQGVGKKTICYGFAKMLTVNQVPEELQGYSLVGIDTTKIMLETNSSSEYEEVIKELFSELSKGSYILFIKEAGMLARNKNNDGTDEIAKYLKPKILSGELRALLAIDTTNFKKYIESDVELMSVLQNIRVEECNQVQALEITNGVKSKFETHYDVMIDEEAIESAVVLTNRYIKNRLFPEKSIDLIDDASSLLLMDIANGKATKRIVTKEYMERTIGIWTGIPMDKVQVEDKERLQKMDDYLRQRVIGQDEAVKAVSDAFRRSKSGLQDPNRPLGTFLFIGTTGVGKTELAKSLAEFVFYDETNLVRIDMSEFMDKASIVRLVGPPVGTPGYEHGGLLTESVRNKPYQLILFDEIEKAHPEVMNLMLQLLDEGRLTDSKGVTVDFRNTIIILTSNIAHDVPSYKRLEVLTKYLRPELVNRIDDIVSFNQLVEEDMLKIVELNLRKLTKKAKAAQNLVMDITTFAKRWFVDELFTSKMGVRALKRLIQHEVENVMAMKIMSGEINYGDTVVIDSPDRTNLEIYAKEKDEEVHEEVISETKLKAEQEESQEQPEMVEVEIFNKIDPSKYVNNDEDDDLEDDIFDEVEESNFDEDTEEESKPEKDEQDELDDLFDDVGGDVQEPVEKPKQEPKKQPALNHNFNPAVAAALAKARQATARPKKKKQS